MKSLLVILWMVILSDGVGALVGAISAWQMRDKSGRRPEFFIACAFALLCYSLSAFGSTWNSVTHGPSINYPGEFLGAAIGFRSLQTIGIWAFTLTIMGGERGFVRRMIFRVIDWVRGPAPPEAEMSITSGQLPPNYWDERFDRLEKKVNGVRRDRENDEHPR